MIAGIQPVKNFKIKTISNPNSPLLTEFRKELFEYDLGIDPELIYAQQPRSWWLENFNERIAEDAFKYCNFKWDTVGFNNIEAIIENGKVVGMSGCRLYGKYLRTSMHLYLLKRVRSKYPGIKYLKGGWFERHMKYAVKHNCDGMFFTVFAYSKKLQGLINNHRGRTISLVDRSHLLYMDKITDAGEYLFNGVPQTFFYYPLLTPVEEFNPNEFI